MVRSTLLGDTGVPPEIVTALTEDDDWLVASTAADYDSRTP
jgi:hypothetical protein